MSAPKQKSMYDTSHLSYPKILHSFVSYAFESFKSVFKDIRFAFINPDDNFVTSDLPRRKSAKASEHAYVVGCFGFC